MLFSTNSLHSYKQSTRVPFFLQSLKHLFVDLFIMAICTAMKWYLIVVLICISLRASYAEHPFIYLWALCMSSLEKCLFKSLAHFFIFIFYCCSSTVVSIFAHHSPPPPQPYPPPTLDPTHLWLCPCVLYTCSLTTLPSNPLNISSHLPSGYYQFVLSFKVSGYLLLACLFC